ncbi:class I SAM-dependent methyltransferase [Flavobacteriaceae bacterium LMO-SS05]
MNEAYKKIIEHYESCLEAHGDTHLGVDWPNAKDAQTRYQVMLDVIKEQEGSVSLLDFGCGTSHLYQFIQDAGLYDINYSGLDLSTAYIEISKRKYPENRYFNLDILKEHQDLPAFDYIVCNGVFTEKRELSFDAMWLYFKAMLPIIFSKAEKGIAFNVMSKTVDWERWDLFHVSTDLLIDFMTKALSRNFVIRNDYGLYEYTVYLYK